MEKGNKIIVAGLGEVGKPLFELISRHYDTIGMDVAPVHVTGDVDILHVCYPYQIEDFIGETARYISRFKPALTVINSTVAIGTSRAVAERTGVRVVNSPVRGKHARMFEDLRMYTKFIGALDTASGDLASKHFESVGLKTKVLSSPEATELAKLTETTYFGLMIAWAQEVERYCDRSKLSYDEVVSFYDEVPFFPQVKYFPGVIGGHCVMPNIEILGRYASSLILDAIQVSNKTKLEQVVHTNNRDRVTESLGGVAFASD
jgi:UDP-N-acetyl-D-mannosaminuronate dehydrogenase